LTVFRHVIDRLSKMRIIVHAPNIQKKQNVHHENKQVGGQGGILD
jgi:hypothetical protein